ncbi:MAG: hypothetical protein IKA31_02740 [Clostridia bacterium]|nr:hypothetical protein [Clostridia bacterium]
MVRRRINMEKQLFNVGETAYTPHDGEIIPFYVTATAIRTTPHNVKIRDYYCNCRKHNLPLPSHKGNNGRDRIRQNHNLFKTPELAQKYLIRQTKANKLPRPAKCSNKDN